MTAPYTIPGTALELPRWLNPVPRGSPKMIAARAVMWGGYIHLQKGITDRRLARTERPRYLTP